MLHQQLQEGDCDIMTIEHSFNCPSRFAEEIAREKILEHILSSPGYPFSIRKHRKVRDRHDPDEQSRFITYPQLVPMLEYAKKHVDPFFTSSIQIGLCLTDDSAYIHKDLIAYWDSWWRIFCNSPGVIAPRLELPLTKYQKSEVLSRLERDAPELYGLISYCTSPDYKEKKWEPCGICISCLDHQLAIRLLKEKTNRKLQLKRSGLYADDYVTDKLASDTEDVHDEDPLVVVNP